MSKDNIIKPISNQTIKNTQNNIAQTTIKSVNAYDLIRELILSGEFLPGSRLVLADLEVRLGFGRGAIREAIMRLDKSGLVQNIPYKGAVVAKLPTYKEIAYIYEARILIECQLARESMQYMTKKDITKLEKLAKNIQSSYKDNPFIFCNDREFHMAIYKISNMNYLLAAIERLLDHVEVFMNTKYYTEEVAEVFFNQHKQMLNAIKNNDTEELCNTLKENIVSGFKRIEDFTYFSRN